MKFFSWLFKRRRKTEREESVVERVDTAILETEERRIVYQISEDLSHAVVVGYVGNISDVFIQGNYNGVPVTKIGKSAFANCNGLKWVEMGENVEIIEKSAFFSCKNL